jgi:HlyD family secretion protein
MNNLSLRRLLALLILFAMAAGGGGCTKRNAGPVFETAPITRGSITQRITATGSLNAVVSVDVGSQISGSIKTVDVDYNSPVKNGQRVALIDPAY